MILLGFEPRIHDSKSWVLNHYTIGSSHLLSLPSLYYTDKNRKFFNLFSFFFLKWKRQKTFGFLLSYIINEIFTNIPVASWRRGSAPVFNPSSPPEVGRSKLPLAATIYLFLFQFFICLFYVFLHEWIWVVKKMLHHRLELWTFGS